MNEILVPRSAAAEDAVREVLRELAADFEGTLDDRASGEAALSFPIRHRFFTGTLAVRTRWEPREESMIFRAEVDSSSAGFTQAGKSLLVLGFLSWLGAVRRPAYFSPEFYLRRLQTELSRMKAEEKQAEG